MFTETPGKYCVLFCVFAVSLSVPFDLVPRGVLSNGPFVYLAVRDRVQHAHRTDMHKSEMGGARAESGAWRSRKWKSLGEHVAVGWVRISMLL